MMQKTSRDNFSSGPNIGLDFFRQLRLALPVWSIAIFLPIPALLTGDANRNAELALLYLGLASGLLAEEVMRSAGLPHNRGEWTTKLLALWTALLCNVAVFVGLGLAAGIKMNLPFPLIAILAVFPAAGIVPWLALRLEHRFTAVILAGMLVFSSKLIGCVVARITYGPNYIQLGYVADDWRTAKVMISILWSLTVLFSVAGIVLGFRSFKSQESTA